MGFLCKIYPRQFYSLSKITLKSRIIQAAPVQIITDVVRLPVVCGICRKT